jgi:hypothetical protein
MVTDTQVRLLRRKMIEGETQRTAAAIAGMSERAARKWQKGPLPSETKVDRSWRTRKDPFADVWDTEVVPLLVADEDGVLDATTILAELQRKHVDGHGPEQLRTLQRRVREWRALHGHDKEVMFEQVHEAGREGAFDFTDCNELGVTIAGQAFAHLFFQFILSFSKWRFVCLAFSETYEAMVHGLQSALWELRGVPRVLRSDNLSAATHQLLDGGRELTRRYKGFLDHYGVRSTRIEPGESHQNGVAEKSHDILKSALRQALVLRGSKDFASVAAYEAFFGEVRDRLNDARVLGRLVEERAHLGALPTTRVPEYTTYTATVRQWSTIHFGRRVYSVPSRLINHEVQVRLHADVVEVYFAGKLTETMPRLRGDRYHRIDYRHVIWSLVRKPGAFARYRYREELFPSLVFRRAYDALVDARGERADVEYVRLLHLAASTMQSRVEEVLTDLLDRGERPDYADVKALCAPDKPTIPVINIPPPDLSAYDRLLAGGAS